MLVFDFVSYVVPNKVLSIENSSASLEFGIVKNEFHEDNIRGKILLPNSLRYWEDIWCHAPSLEGGSIY